MLVGVCIRYTEVENDYGNMQDAVYVECVKCGRFSEDSFIANGVSADFRTPSVKRCMVLLAKECKAVCGLNTLFVGATPSACKC